MIGIVGPGLLGRGWSRHMTVSYFARGGVRSGCRFAHRGMVNARSSAWFSTTVFIIVAARFYISPGSCPIFTCNIIVN